MLSLLDELLVPGPLRGRELGVDLRPHARLDGIELRPDPRPQGIGLRLVTGENRADGIALRRVEVQLPAQIGDDRVRSAPRSTASALAVGGFVASPARKSSGQEDGG